MHDTSDLTDTYIRTSLTPYTLHLTPHLHLTPPPGLGTGRESSKGGMEANLLALREPKVVLLQKFGATKFHIFMGYSENSPKAACSDLDILMIAAQGCDFPPLPKPIARLRSWCEGKARELLVQQPVLSSWHERWRDMLHKLPNVYRNSTRCLKSWRCTTKNQQPQRHRRKQSRFCSHLIHLEHSNPKQMR